MYRSVFFWRRVSKCLIQMSDVVFAGESVKCHVCNSGKAYEGEKCADPLRHMDFVKDCTEEGKKDHLNYTMCRKLTQDGEGQWEFFINIGCSKEIEIPFWSADYKLLIVIDLGIFRNPVVLPYFSFYDVLIDPAPTFYWSLYEKW